MLPVTYATFSALFGTFSVVQAKVLSELVTLQLEGSSNIFWGSDAWFTYVTLVAWLAFVGVWLFRMNEALSLYDPLFIIPLLQVNFILFAIVSGKTLCVENLTHVLFLSFLALDLIVSSSFRRGLLTSGLFPSFRSFVCCCNYRWHLLQRIQLLRRVERDWLRVRGLSSYRRHFLAEPHR